MHIIIEKMRLDRSLQVINVLSNTKLPGSFGIAAVYSGVFLPQRVEWSPGPFSSNLEVAPWRCLAAVVPVEIATVATRFEIAPPFFRKNSPLLCEIECAVSRGKMGVLTQVRVNCVRKIHRRNKDSDSS